MTPRESARGLEEITSSESPSPAPQQSLKALMCGQAPSPLGTPLSHTVPHSAAL